MKSSFAKHRQNRAISIRVFIALASLALGLVCTELLARNEPHPVAKEMKMAAQRMAQAEAVVAKKRLAMGLTIDPVLDPYQTGLIGVESSILTTTVGDIVSKRTSTNTAFAALIVRYFYDIGLESGDRIAVGSSGSFPAILIAVLSACAETGVEPIIIASIGASEYGANIEGFSNAEIMAACRDAGVLPYMPIAISPGGEDDLGISSMYRFEPSDELARYAHSVAQSLAIPLILASDLEDSFKAHLEAYEKASPIRLFVNIGGADVNFGSGPASLKLKPGLIIPSARTRKTDLGKLHKQAPKDPEKSAQQVTSRSGTMDADSGVDAQAGLIAYYLAKGIPVLHFLNIKGLAVQSGIPVDGDPRAPLPSSIVSTRKKPSWPLIVSLLIAGTALAIRKPLRYYP